MTDTLDQTIDRLHRRSKQFQRGLPSTRRDRVLFTALVAVFVLGSIAICVYFTLPAWEGVQKMFQTLLGHTVGLVVASILIAIGVGFLTTCLSLILFWMGQLLFPFAYRAYRDDQYSLGQSHPFEGE
jgi:hypothetical protein